MKKETNIKTNRMDNNALFPTIMLIVLCHRANDFILFKHLLFKQFCLKCTIEIVSLLAMVPVQRLMFYLHFHSRWFLFWSFR